MHHAMLCQLYLGLQWLHGVGHPFFCSQTFQRPGCRKNSPKLPCSSHLELNYLAVLIRNVPRLMPAVMHTGSVIWDTMHSLLSIVWVALVEWEKLKMLYLSLIRSLSEYFFVFMYCYVNAFSPNAPSFCCVECCFSTNVFQLFATNRLIKVFEVLKSVVWRNVVSALTTPVPAFLLAL